MPPDGAAARAATAPRSFRAIVRGLAAVAALFITAADALVTAALGIPRLAWLAQRARSVCAEEYRRARWDAVDAEEVPGDPGSEDGWPGEGSAF